MSKYLPFSFKHLLFAATLSFLLTGCVSSGKQTQYYSLFPVKFDAGAATYALSSEDFSLGVGPVSLPEFMDNPSIVSLTYTQQIRISRHHAWAGDLKASVIRVISSNLSQRLNHEKIQSFPWDTRIRPKYQLRINLEDFSGIPGGDVNLVASWVLMDTQKNREVMVGRERINLSSVNDSVDSYVEALNLLINKFTAVLAQKIAVNL
ncbi:PqiC family protein [Teredinibacter haidensis]|uniref:PqiC family protein n=1 Tax=Teredinibacter haidensis TaxID=2731755 RepID=UPI0009F9A370|nr:PqiC family protein [Teredinibacter haidensis]